MTELKALDKSELIKPDIAKQEMNQRLRALEDFQRATLNIMEDFDAEREKHQKLQQAMMNILEDFDEEQGKYQLIQKATLNLLEDMDEERRALDGTQKALLNMLEDIEIERTKAEQAIAQLARSNAELEQFAYVASHDLQEPLRMISSYVQLLSRRYSGRLDNDADEFIAYAVDGTKRMQQLINDLLAYSRVGTRGKPPAPADFEGVLSKAMANLEIAIKESSVLVTHDPLPVVMVDELQMVQLLQNLIGNAIKFKSTQRPQIHISARLEGAEWIFSVKDNGIGIDPQFHDRIFVLFQRLHSREEYPGTGIGLTISKKIMERHGGRIWLESKPGLGSTFYFSLPAQIDAGPGQYSRQNEGN